MSTPIPNAQSVLAQYFGEKARYRRGLAENQEAWEGNKNQCYTDSLDVMAEYVGSLPDGDPTLQKLVECEDFWYVGDVFSEPVSAGSIGPTETNTAAIHIGPRNSVITLDECPEEFRSWAEIALREAKAVREAEAE
jgi:hypothetical protein